MYSQIGNVDSRENEIKPTNLAPLVIFVYDREDKTRALLGSLLNVELIENTDLYIFSDGAKNEDRAGDVDKVRSYIASLDLQFKFRSFIFIKRDHNIGLARSIIEGVTQVIDKYEKVIVLEDDNIVSRDFLKYMDYCLDRYKGNKMIGSIGGMSFMFKDDFPPDYKEDVYLLDRTCSFAWGTWSEVWNQIDWEVRDYKHFRKDKKARKQYNRSGNGSSYLLDAYMHGRVNSWAVRFDYSHFKNGQYTLYPRLSKAKNVGYDGTGTHYKKEQKLMRWEVNVGKIDFSENRADEKWYVEDLKLNEAIQEAFRRNNMLSPMKLFLKYVKMYMIYYREKIAKKLIKSRRNA